MTNGEKIKQTFPGLHIDEGELEVYMWTTTHDAIDIPLDWWSEEYKEPASKNDLTGDCISRQATLEPYRILKDTDTLCVALVRANIMQQPSINPQEPKTGHRVYDDLFGSYYCSECNSYLRDYDNYCPNCGAKMMESEDNNGKDT